MGKTLSRPRWYHHVIVIGFTVSLIGFGMRSLVTHDSRFGWGMFSEETNYRLSYAWVFPDGRLRPFVPQKGDILKGRAWRWLRSGRANQTRYGRGTVRSWVKGFLRTMVQVYPLEGAVGMRAILRYRLNEAGEAAEEMFTYPDPLLL